MPGTPGSERALAPAEALERLGGGLLPDDIGPLDDSPVLVVSLDGGGPIAELADISRNLPCVVIGTGLPGSVPEDVSEGFDVLITPEPGPPRPWVHAGDARAVRNLLVEAVTAHPLPAVVLVQLLRYSTDLATSDALVAESMAYSMLQAGPDFRRWLRRRRRQPPGRRGQPPGRRGQPPDEPRAEPVMAHRSEGGSLDIELNRPGTHNALDAALRRALIEVLRVAVADADVREVRLSGRGPSFCSGGDLAEFGSGPDPATAHFARLAGSVGYWLDRCADRLAVEVHGHCVGAGVEMAAFARRVAARPGTVFRLPEVGMGLIPGAGGTVSIPRRIGRHRTAFLALSGATLSVEGALDWELVDEIGSA